MILLELYLLVIHGLSMVKLWISARMYSEIRHEVGEFDLMALNAWPSFENS